MEGITHEFVGPGEDEDTGHVVELYVTRDALVNLRDNSSRPHSKFFMGLLADYDRLKFEAEEHQPPLPGL